MHWLEKRWNNQPDKVLVHSFIRSFIYPFIHFFIHSFVLSVIHSTFYLFKFCSIVHKIKLVALLSLLFDVEIAMGKSHVTLLALYDCSWRLTWRRAYHEALLQLPETSLGLTGPSSPDSQIVIRWVNAIRWDSQLVSHPDSPAFDFCEQ